MALSASRLTTAIVNSFKALSPGMTDAQVAQLQNAWTDIVQDIITEITANAVATSSIPADSIATTGSPSAQVGPTGPVSIMGGVS